MADEVSISPEMVEAGVKEFERWFARDEHHEALVEMPSNASIGDLVLLIFRAMMSELSEHDRILAQYGEPRKGLPPDWNK